MSCPFNKQYQNKELNSIPKLLIMEGLTLLKQKNVDFAFKDSNQHPNEIKPFHINGVIFDGILTYNNMPYKCIIRLSSASPVWNSSAMALKISNLTNNKYKDILLLSDQSTNITSNYFETGLSNMILNDNYLSINNDLNIDSFSKFTQNYDPINNTLAKTDPHIRALNVEQFFKDCFAIYLFPKKYPMNINSISDFDKNMKYTMLYDVYGIKIVNNKQEINKIASLKIKNKKPIIDDGTNKLYFKHSKLKKKYEKDYIRFMKKSKIGTRYWGTKIGSSLINDVSFLKQDKTKLNQLGEYNNMIFEACKNIYKKFNN